MGVKYIIATKTHAQHRPASKVSPTTQCSSAQHVTCCGLMKSLLDCLLYTHCVRKVCLADDVFQLLHLTVAVLFAEQLQKDLEALNKGNRPAVSLAAKWAPTPASKQQQSPTCRHPACAHQAPLHCSIADGLHGLIIWFCMEGYCDVSWL